MMECKKCGKEAIKNGKSKIGTQRYRCKNCRYCFQSSYIYSSYSVSNQELILLTKEGCGIRSTARILSISPNTVIRRIVDIGTQLTRPYPIFSGKKYEVDELFTFVGNKSNRICVAYSLEPISGKIIDIVVGKRNKTNLSKVIHTLILSNAAQIRTDKLALYTSIIPEEIHQVKNRGINKIERKNLNLRTHLKRLGRKTICYSKSLLVLLCVIKIYFWA